MEDSDKCVALEDSIKQLWLTLGEMENTEGFAPKSPVLQSWVGLNA